MNIRLFWNTVRYLRPIQVYWRLFLKFSNPRINFDSTPELRAHGRKWTAAILKEQSYFPPNTFKFLNYEDSIVGVNDWNNHEHEKLWLYNLHYFDDLNAEGREKRAEKHSILIDRWIADNPPMEGNGWEPYPTSLRIVNWIKWSLFGNLLSENQVQSLALQIRWLAKRLEYHLLGNHLIANAKALVFAGCFFEGREAQRWLLKGLKILTEELPEQVLPDGGHFERSPMYHAIILEDLLDLLNVANVYCHAIKKDTTDYWAVTAQKMLQAYTCLCHPDDEIAFFNDASIGIASSLSTVQQYADRLGVGYSFENSRIGELSETGYYSVRRKEWALLVDCAPVGPDYLPGHAHADTLSFELSKGSQRVLVNSGTSCYGINQERLRQRGTAAHNAVTVDGENSSEVWSGFRVARRARIVDKCISSSDTVDSIFATHDGFRRLPNVWEHRRDWVISEDRMVIKDRLGGKGMHNVAVFYHFHPAIDVKLEDGNRLCIAINDGRLAEMLLDESLSWRLYRGSYHPEFGVSIDNWELVGEQELEFPVAITNNILFIED